MSLLSDIPLSSLHFYLTAPYQCSYLPEKQARSQVASPTFMIDSRVYSELVRHGFRRSGTFTYRPRCDNCSACQPLRVLTKEFAPSRSQRRAWKRHNNLEATLHALKDDAEHYALYQRYQNARHRHGGMDQDDRDAYQSFLLQSHVDSLLVEFRDPPATPGGNGTLRMVSVIDLLTDGLSSVYTFFDPDLPNASLGVYNILWQIELSRKLNLDYLYLGYWIAESRKMSYKTQYQPAEKLTGSTWTTFSSPDTSSGSHN